MSDEMSDGRGPADPGRKAPGDADHTAAERREPARPDRRARWRGGRRASDSLANAAKFVYQLLTNPPD